MERLPVNVLRVQDLEASMSFYRAGLGFELHFFGEDVAQVAPPGGVPLLLTTRDAGDVAAYMHETFSEAPAGKLVYGFAPHDLDQYRRDLLAHGIEPGPVELHDDESRTLQVTDPDGFRISFWEAPRLSDDEVIERFAAAPGLLTAALAGLSEEQLDLARAPDKWTIRQTVHHVADSAASSLVRILMALAEPGRTFHNNPYSQDKWVAGLDHAHRPVDTAVALLRAIHGHVSLLVRSLESPLDRWLEGDLSGRTTVRQMLTMLAGHVSGHAAQIRETRRVHGI